MAKQPSQGRVRRRERKNITSGVAHVNSTFNNTMITITDVQGNTIAWASGVKVLPPSPVPPLLRSRAYRVCGAHQLSAPYAL